MRIYRWLGFLSAILIVLSLPACGGRGNVDDTEGTGASLGLKLKIISGNNQVYHAKKTFKESLVVEVQAPDGSPVPDIPVEFSEVTGTGAQILTPKSISDKDGRVETQVVAPNAYDKDITIEARITDTTDTTEFALATTVVVGEVQFIAGMEPPSNYTAHHIDPVPEFHVRILNEEGEFIALTSERHRIELSLVSGTGELLGTLSQGFVDGVAAFDDIRYIRAEDITLRAKHNKSDKHTEHTLTVDPGSATQAIVVLPGQTFQPGQKNLSSAITGTMNAVTADDTFTVSVKAVDDYFNLDPTATQSVSVSTVNDPNDTEPVAQNWVDGEADFVISPVAAKMGHEISLTSPLASNHSSSSYQIKPGAPTNILVRLPGQTFNPGQTALASAITGSPSQQTAGAAFTAEVIATDSEFNVVNVNSTAAVASSDASDTEPASQALSNGRRDFSVTNVTAGVTHTLTPSAAGLSSQVSSTYSVTHNQADHLVVETAPADLTTAGDEIPLVLSARDAYGNLVSTGPDASANVTVSLKQGAGSLLGTTSKAFSGGLVDFTGTGLAIDRVGNDKLLTATKASTSGSGGVGSLSVDTSVFSVTPAAPSDFELSGPSNVLAGDCTVYEVILRDVYGNETSSASGLTAQMSGEGSGTYYSDNCSTTLSGNSLNFASGQSRKTLYYRNTVDEVVTLKSDDGAGGLGAGTHTVDVDHLALDHFVVSGVSDPATAGTAEDLIVEAQDIFNNRVLDYTGTVQILSDDGAAQLPVDYTFTLSDAGYKLFTSGVTLNTTGTYYVRVEDTSDVGKFGEQSGILVKPGALDHFTVSGINDPAVAGTAESVTVTAYDSQNNVKTDYTGTITFTSDDAAATLPGDYSYLSGDAGVKTFTGSVTLNTTGTYYVKVEDTGDATKTGQQSNIDVNPGALDHFTVLGITDPTTAGASETVTVTAYDAQNNVKTDYTGTITFTSDDAAASLPGDYTFLSGDSGSKAFTGGVTLNTTGTCYVKVEDAGDATKAGQQSNIDVNPGAIDHFTVSGVADPTTAGASETVTVTAYDAQNNVKTDYTGTITFTSDDAAATLPADYSFLSGDAGAKTFTGAVTLITTGTYYVKVEDTSDANKTGQQSNIDVNPGAIDHFTVSGISDPAVAGTAESVTVTAYDAQNNVKTDYTGTITFTSDDAAATLPGDYSFLSGDAGVKTFSGAVTLNTTGTYYVKVEDTGDATKTGQQSSIDVNPGAIDHFTVSGITDPTTAGASETVTVTAYDAQNNVKTDYTGTITFTSDDAAATLPGDYTFLSGDNGAKTFTGAVALNTTGTYYVKVEDTGNATKTGQQSNIDVNPGALDHFTVTGITDPAVAGTAETVSVTAYDAQNNIKTDYTGTITFSSDDAAATLPGDYTYLSGDNGAVTFSGAVTLNTTGTYYVKVEDTGDAAKDGQQANIDVNPGALDHFTVTGISDPTQAGNPESPVVTAYDAQGNVKTDYTGTITFSTDDASADLPGDYTFTLSDAGQKAFTGALALKTTGTYYVKVEDTGDATKAGQQSNIDVDPAVLSHFTVAGISDPTTAGTAESVTVTAYDTLGNVKSDYVGTIHFSSADAAATLPGDYTYLSGDNGAKTFSSAVTLNTTGTYYVKVEDTSDATKTGQQSNIDVNPGALDHFTVSGVTDPTTAGASETVTVTAYDAQNNIKTDYTGTITFTSDDAAASLPGDYTYLSGDSGAKTFSSAVTLNTTGTYYVKVEDTGDATKTGQQSNIDVNPGALDHFVVSGISDPTVAGTAETVTVTAYDAQNNIKTDYTGTITFSSDDGGATLPLDSTFQLSDNGAKTFTGGVTLRTTGVYYVKVEDTGDITKTGQQSSIDVSPAGLDHFTVSGISDPTIAGSAETVSVTAYDTEGNIKTDYTGTITFTSDDAAATLPGDYAFLGGDNGAKTFSGAVTLNTTGTYYVRVEDTGDAAKTGQQSNINVNPGALDHFTVSGITDPTTAGASETVTVTAYDAQNNIKTDYTGTVTFTSDDAAATLPGDYTYLGGDNGVKTFSGAVTLNTTGTYYVKVEDAGDATKAGQQSNIDVNPGALDHFTVSGITDPTTAGAAETVTVTAYDAQNNVKTDYTGAITFSSDDAAATLPGDYTYLSGDNGAKTFSGAVTLNTTGTYYVKVEDTGDATKTGQQSNIDVNPGALDHFVVSGVSDPTVAGTAETVSVTAYDAQNNIKTDYTGTITFTSDDAAATLPGNYTFLSGDNGAKTFSGAVTLNTTGSYYVKVEDTGDATRAGQQSSIDVNPGALDRFTVSGITDPTTAGASETVTVTAYDAQNNVKTDYTGTITFSSDDAATTLPGDYTFLGGDSGSKTFTGAVALNTTGTYYVKVEDTGDATKTGQQSNIDVNPGALDHFTVTGITDPTVAGTAETATVTAYDAQNNIKTDYTGTITFSSDDAAATLPGDYTYLSGDNGVKTFSGAVTLNTTGTYYVKVEDTGDATKTGQKSNIDVNPGALDHFAVTGITDPTVAGTAETATVTAYDAQNNVKTDYTGTITFSSDDAAATLPGDYTFLSGDAGTKTFSGAVTLKTTGAYYVKVEDTGDATKSGQQSNIDVNPAALDHFTVAGITDPTTAGAAESVTVTAYDNEGNVKTDYTGTIAFSSDDAAASLPSDYTFLSGDNGAKTFSGAVTLNTTGTYYVKVEDTGDATKTGQQSNIDVNPGSLDHFTVTGITDPTVAGTAETASVTAYDAQNNVKTDYTGTITFSSDDGAASLPGDYTFLSGDSGSKSFTGAVTLNTTGTYYVKVEDTGDATKSGQQSDIDVNPAALDHFTVAGITDPTTAGASESVTVTAYDTQGNIKTDYTGTITFTSDDGAASLPGDYTFLSGDSGSKSFTGAVTLNTTGTYYVKVEDTGDATKTGQQASIDVNPGALDHFTVSGVTDPTTAGSSETVTVTAYDAKNNIKTDYTGTITFTSDDAAASLPGDYTYLSGDNGAKTFSSAVTLNTTGTYFVKVEDTGDATKTGQQSNIDVNPGALDHFTVSGVTDPTTAGAAETVTVTAYDALNNVKTDYTGAITFSSDDGAATLPGDYTFLSGDNGAKTFTGAVALNTTGTYYVKVEDTGDASKTGQQSNIDVNPAALDHFTVSGINDPTTAGASESVTVTAYDTAGNVKTDYTGTITFSSDEGAANLPGDYTFLGGDNGSKAFTGAVTLNTTGTYYVKVEDTSDATKVGQQSNIDVNPGALDHFTVSGVTDPTTAGAAETVTVTAYDALNNVKTDYTGTITFSSDDAAATLPGDYTFLSGDNGSKAFTGAVTLNTTGTYFVKVEDTGDASKTGQQSNIDVNPGALDHFAVSGVSDPTVAGTAETVTVTAYDAQNNIKTDYTGTITFLSDDGAATLPLDYTFLLSDSGSHTFSSSVTLNTTGTYYLKVEDTGDITKTGQQSNIDVSPGALDYFTVAGITDPTNAGVAESATVTAYDAQNNVKTDYTGTITFSSDDAAATLPGDYTFLSGDNGVKTFTGAVTLNTTGSYYVKVEDTGDASKVGQQSDIDVKPAGIGYFTVAGITDPTIAGASETVTVTAYDTQGNVKTDYTGTITFSSDDAAASLPTDYTFLNGNNGTKSFSLSLNTTGSYYVKVEDTGDATKTGEQSNIDVNPSALDHFTVVGVTDPATAGSAETVTITAYDTQGNVKTDYTGTITFSSDDGAASLPADYTFLSGDNGAKTFSGAVTLKTTGTYYVKVEDTADATKSGQQSNIDVNPAALDSFTVTGITDPTAAGAAESVTVTAFDTQGNVKTDYTGTITFSTDDGAASLPGDYTFLSGDNGAKTFTGAVTLNTTGTYYVKVEDTADATKSGQQSNIDVNPAALDSFTVTGINDPTTAGAAETVTITAYDTQGNVKTDYTGTITFTSDDGAASLPGDYTFLSGDSGSKAFTGAVTLNTTGTYYVKVEDTSDATKVGQQSNIDVNPAALDHFTVSGINDPTTAGTAESVTVTAYDTAGNIKTDYTGTISFTSDDGAATLPGDYTFLSGDNGAKTFTGAVTLNTTGTYYVKVEDTGDATKAGQQSNIDVNPAALDHFTVSGITDPTNAGSAESVTVTAYDALNNIKTDYAGTITFSSNDGAASLPGDYTFLSGDSGSKAFTGAVTLNTTGTYYVKVEDTGDATKVGQQSNIDVNPATLDHFTVSGITDPTSAGAAESVTVTAYDTAGNIKTDYTGTISFTSDDGAASLPGDYTFLSGDNGTKTFTGAVTLNTSGTYYVKVEDTGDASKVGQQSSIAVNPGALDHFTVTGITDPTTAGAAESATVTAYDALNNIKTDYTGTITFSSDDGAATLPGDYTFLSGDNGSKTFTGAVTLNTTGTYYVKVEDTGDATKVGQQSNIDVNPAALDYFTVSGVTDPTTAGAAESVTVTAYDTAGNVKTDYVGTITFSSDEGAASLPGDYTFLSGDNGAKTFTGAVTLNTTGTYYVKVEDTGDASKSGQQSNIDVNPATLDHFTVSGITDPTSAGAAETVTITAYDTQGNIKTDYTGTITFTSDDGAATLPGDYTFLSGDNGAKTFTGAVTLNTTGTYYVKVEDTGDATKTGQQSNIDVNPAALDHFTVSGVTDPTTAGAAESVTVTAYDTQGNIKTDYTGTITFTSDDGAASLPGDYTFLGGDNGAKTFTGAVTLNTTGTYYVKVEDTGDATKTGQQSNIDVNPSALDHFTVTGITDPTTAGSTESVTVTAYDTQGNIKTDYTGTITFSSDDGAATLPGDYTFLSGDNGVKAFTGAVTLNTTGTYYVKVEDTGDATKTGQQSNIDVNPSALDHFTVTGITDPTTAGSTESVTVTAYDTQGNIKTDYTGTITFSSDDGAATLPGDYTFLSGDNGVKAFTGAVTLNTTGTFYVKVEDTGDATKSGQQSNIDVTPGALDHFTVTGITDPTTAGAAESTTVTAYDAQNNVKTDYTGTITFTSDDASASLPGDYTFLSGDNGVKAFSGAVTLNTTGTYYVKVEDTGDATKTGQQSNIDVNPATLDHFTVTGITDPTSAGTAESVTVTAYDTLGNIKTDYTGTITFSSDDGAATLPGDYTYLSGDNGAKTFTGAVTLNSTGTYYVKVEDTGDATKTGQQSNIDVNPAALDHFTVTGITDPTSAGTAESVTVTAYDTQGNIKTDYTGTITFTSDDGAASLPGDYTFLGGDNGVKAFTGAVTLNTTGTYYVKVEDTGDATKTGQQSNIDVNPASLDHFTVSGVTDPTTAGAAETVTVTAYDTAGNIKTDYTGTITFTSDDASASLPGDYTFLSGDNGSKAFTGAVTLNTTGTYYVKVEDTGDATKTGQQSNIDVNPGALDHFTVTGITDPTTAGTAESATVTAYDAQNNVKTDYTGTITFSSDDGAATLPGDYTFLSGDNGSKAFTGAVTLNTTGTYYVKVEDAGDATKTGQQSNIDVNPAALDHFTVSGITDPTTAGAAETVTVTAYDTAGNIKADYTGTITFSSDDGAATLPGDYTFLSGDNGAKTFTGAVTLNTTGTYYVKVEDTGDATKSGQQSNIDVNPGAIDHFTVTGINDPTAAGTAETPTVTAYDALNNVKTDYTGTIAFSSDDGSASLPGDYTFLSGDNGSKAFTGAVTLNTTGTFYVKVEDAGDATKTGQQSNIDVNPAALDYFTVTGITDPTTAGTAESVTVTAYDTQGNVKTDYTGTITFTSDDGAATLPGDYTFLSGDNGAKTFTGAVTLNTTGTYYVKVEDTGDATKVGQQSSIDVNPGALDHFTVAGITDPTTAGTAETPTVTAYDAQNNIKTDYIGTITFSSDDASAALPSDYTFLVGDSGSKAFTGAVTLNTTGTYYVKVEDTGDATKSGQQSNIDVSPSALDHFTVTGVTDPTTAGTAESVTVTAYDTKGNIKSDYTGTITFTSDDAAAALPGDYTFLSGDNGAKTFTGAVTLNTTGTYYVKVEDTGDATKTGQQSNIDVSPGALDHFTVTGITDPTIAGSAENVTVTAYDAQSNVKTDYTGTISFTSDDAAASLPGDYTFLSGDSGSKSFASGVILNTTGTFYVKVEDTGDATKVGQQSSIDVNPGALDHFTVTGIGDPTTAGTAETPTVTAYDAQNNVKTDYTGTITFSSDDGSASLPSDYTFLSGDNGAKTFTSAVTLNTPGLYYVKVADTGDGTKNGQQSGIDVNPAALDHFVVSGIADPTTAGAAQNVTVTAYDTLGNIKTDYTGTITFSSDDAAASLPGDYTFLSGDNGSKSFASGVILNTTGTFYVKVEDTGDATKTGQQSSIDVTPGALDYFTVSGINDPTNERSAETPTVTAYDAQSNVKSDYTGTITFSSDDSTADLPSDYTFLSGDNGTKTFTGAVTFNTPGTYYLKVADTGDGTKAGQQSSIDVLEICEPDHFHVATLDSGDVMTSTFSADEGFKVQLTAHDASHVTETCYVGSKSVTWSMNGTTASSFYCGASSGAPVDPTETTLSFSSGVATTSASASFKVAESGATVGATIGSISGTSGSITVTAGTVCHIELRNAAANGGSAITGASLNLTDTLNLYVAGYDQYQNYNSDVASVWSGANGAYPWTQPGNASSTSNAADVVGVKITTSGTIQADYNGGGGELTDSIAVTIAGGGNESLAWTSASTSSDGVNTHNMLGSNNINATFYWNATELTDTWRTAGTQSWYSESFAANSRGSRKDFPERALLVAHSSGLDIIDATNNHLWMRFSSGAGNLIDSSYGAIQDVTALNGKIYLAMKDASDTTGSLVILDMASDAAYRTDASGGYIASVTIASRNAGTNTWSSNATYPALTQSSIYSLNSRRVGAVDYVLAGTSSTAELLQDNGTTITVFQNDATTPLANPAVSVYLGSDEKIYIAEDNVGIHTATHGADPLPLAADFVLTLSYDQSTSTAKLSSLSINDMDVAEGASGVEAGNHMLFVASEKGVTAIHEHGTSTSATAYGYEPAETSYARNSSFSGFAHLASTTGCVQPATTPSTNSPRTIEMFFKPDQNINNTNNGYYLFNVASGNGYYDIYFNASGQIQAEAKKGGTVSTVTTTTSSWSKDRWYHLVVVFDNSANTTDIWVDGVSEGSGGLPTGFSPATNNHYIGCSGGNANTFPGSIDEFHLFESNNPFSYNAGTPAVPTAEYVGGTYNFHFNDQAGTTAACSGCAAADATLLGASWMASDALVGSSSSVSAVDVYNVGTSVTAQVVSSGASGAWSELSGANSGPSATLGRYQTATDLSDVHVYQMDSVTDLDVILGLTSGGLQLERK